MYFGGSEWVVTAIILSANLLMVLLTTGIVEVVNVSFGGGGGH